MKDRLATIAVLATDVDGVLTRGELYVGGEGEVFKVFNARDGLGIRLLQRAGIEVAMISAKDSDALRRRASDLKITRLMSRRDDKAQALRELAEQTGVSLERIAMVGDDVLDLGAMRLAGVSIAVADAHAKVREEADWVTERDGGCGALREVADAILTAKDVLDSEIERLLADVEA